MQLRDRILNFVAGIPEYTHETKANLEHDSISKGV